MEQTPSSSSGAEGTAATPSGGGTSAFFTRQSSGLVRELGVIPSAAISVAATGPFVAMIVFNSGLVSFSQVDMYVPMLGALAVWLVMLVAYRYLVQAIPRAGGEYVYLSRIVAPVLGAMAGVSIAVVFMYILATNGQLAAAYVPFMLTSLGAAFHSHALVDAANHVGSEGARAAIGAGIVLIAGALSLMPLRRTGRLLVWLLAVQFVAFLVVLLLLLDHSHSTFVSSFGTYAGHPNAYAAMIAAGRKAGVLFGVSGASLIAAIPFMVLGFYGVLYSYYLGGELRRPGRTYVYASLAAIVVLGGLWIALWALARHTVGLDFMQAQSTLGVSDPTAYAHITSLGESTGALGYALVLSGDPVSKILVGIGLPLSMVTINIALVTVTTRVLFAQAFDRLLPLGMAKVSARSHAPTIAVGVAVAGAIVFTILEVFVTITNIVALETLFISLIVLCGTVACTFLPITRPELVSVGRVKGVARWAGVPTITWIGVGATAVILFVIVEIVTHRSVYGNFNAESVISLVVVLLAGPVVYYTVSIVRKRRNRMDLAMIMRELPPD